MKRLSSDSARAGAAGALAVAALSVAVPGWGADAPGPKAPVAAPAASHASPARDGYDGPPTLLGRDRKLKLGGYGALGGGYTRMLGHDSGVMSVEAALLIDHRLSVGVAGYGFTRTPRGPRAADGARQEFGAGYGGLALRYSLFAGASPVYGTFGLVLGAGAINLHRDRDWDDEGDWDDGFEHRDGDDWDAGRFDPFLFAQPEIGLNANATRWLRLGATLGYRFTGGVGRFGLSNSDLNGFVVGANLGFGWF